MRDNRAHHKHFPSGGRSCPGSVPCNPGNVLCPLGARGGGAVGAEAEVLTTGCGHAWAVWFALETLQALPGRTICRARGQTAGMLSASQQPWVHTEVVSGLSSQGHAVANAFLEGCALFSLGFY